MVRWEGVDVIRLCSNVWFVVIICLYVCVCMCLGVMAQGLFARVPQTVVLFIQPFRPGWEVVFVFVCLFRLNHLEKNRNESKS